ncbi:MAG: hypothetical protein IJT69_03910 [Clostridia bacterium]|nr:hypothetical protein [Clostridia bacterium]
MQYEVIGWTNCFDDRFPIFEDVTEEDFKAGWTAVVEEVRRKGYRFGGDSHQNRDCGTPVLNSGEALRCSEREWGWIMADAWLPVSDEFPYGEDFRYMLWYMDDFYEELRPEGMRDIVLPKPFVDMTRIVKR